jgi:hypothetical protein
MRWEGRAFYKFCQTSRLEDCIVYNSSIYQGVLVAGRYQHLHGSARLTSRCTFVVGALLFDVSATRV